ncbi:DUF3866 family protein [Nanchangia anserum]|uniref:DUF3866 family protein n=1 Tax=Nanchangia anserum TaxID=2692125 RepID=A0A8I0GDC9_9ACTO|nr:DUF3866 family protein [Nanchangia anserum]MBD3688797.1 DUF3866 family protein [Nanchangia anserum]QOX82530.1 DUF3866 family protein [Nanchangia anserum]
MMLRDARVEQLGQCWPGVHTARVRITRAPASATLCRDGEVVWALAYVDTVGTLREGASVRIDVSVLAKRLGTGGQALVTAVLDGELPDDVLPDHGGHIVKARYTPAQTLVLAAEEQNSPHHAVIAEARDLAGLPIIACDLHSMVPAVIAGIRLVTPNARVAYVMTDGAALPAAYSRTLAGLREAGWISDVITCGQAYGGSLEAVSIPSALLVARHVGAADIVVASQGPGNAGTGTPWGFSGVDVAWVLTAAARLGGHPIAALRVSSGDQRGRHCGISHHTRAAVGTLTPVGVDVALPLFSASSQLDAEARSVVGDLRADVRELADRRHRVVEVDTTGLAEALAEVPVTLSTMGRSLSEDPATFLAAGAAGIAGARALS